MTSRSAANAGTRQTYMSTQSIYIGDDTCEKSWNQAPPCSPSSEYNFAQNFELLPRTLPDLTDLEIPMVRDKGVKACMDELAEFFGCQHYKTNYVHFWYLDIIIDCIWRSQDQYEFPVQQQKIILGWLLFMMNIVQDPAQNLSRTEFLGLFREVVYVAAELLDEGNLEIQLPLQLVTLLPTAEVPKDEEVDGENGEMESTSEPSKKDVSYYQFPRNDEASPEEKDAVFVPSKETCHCSSFLSNLSSNSTTTTSSSYTKVPTSLISEEQSRTPLDSIKELYKPDLRTPPRFLPIDSTTEIFRNTTVTRTVSEEFCPEDEKALMDKLGSELDQIYSSCSHTIVKIDDEYLKTLKKGHYYVVFQKDSRTDKAEGYPISTDEAANDGDGTPRINGNVQPASTEECVDEEAQRMSIMKKLTRYKIMEQRIRDADDSCVGLEPWQCEEPASDGRASTQADEPANDQDRCPTEQLADLIDEIENEMLEEKKVYNFGILWVLIDIIHDYFNSDFQYTIIKLALTSPPDMIIQILEDEMKIPKILKDDLTVYVKDLADKYKVKEPKPEKIKKEKKKKEKKVKQKKEKVKKDKMSKAERKALEKLRKEELKRQQKLEAELEAERIRKEMDKMYMFPLQDAVDLDFFKTKFKNWKVVDIRKKMKKKK